MRATLTGIELTMYDLELLGIEDQEAFVFTSVSGGETLSNEVRGITHMGILPDTIGSEGGFAKLHFKFKDSEIKFQLPVKGEIKSHAQMQLEQGISFKTGLPLSQKAKEHLMKCCGEISR